MADVTKLNIGGTDYNIVDASVPSWAKQNTKPTYTANEVGAVPTTRKVNGKDLTSDVNTIVYGQKSSTGFRVGTYNSNTNTWAYAPSDTTLSVLTIYFDNSTEKAYTYNGKDLKEFYSTSLANLGAVAFSNSYTDLDDLPTIPSAVTVDSLLSNGGTNPVLGGVIYTALSNKEDKCTVVTIADSGSVSLAMDPNKFYKFTNAISSLTVTLNSGTGLCIYSGKFTAASGGCTLVLPSGVTSGANIPSITGGSSYEFSIMDNVLLMVEL